MPSIGSSRASSVCMAAVPSGPPVDDGHGTVTRVGSTEPTSASFRVGITNNVVAGSKSEIAGCAAVAVVADPGRLVPGPSSDGALDGSPHDQLRVTNNSGPACLTP